MLKNIIIAVLAVAVIILGFLYIGKSANLGGFTDEYNPKVFKNTVTLGSSGSAITSYICSTNTAYNPGSVSSSTAADTKAIDVGLASLGDPVIASLSSATSTELWYVTAKVTAAGTHATGTLYLRGKDGAAVDLSTTTAKICVIH